MARYGFNGKFFLDQKGPIFQGKWILIYLLTNRIGLSVEKVTFFFHFSSFLVDILFLEAGFSLCEPSLDMISSLLLSWMELRDKMWTEIHQTQKDKYCLLIHRQELKKWLSEKECSRGTRDWKGRGYRQLGHWGPKHSYLGTVSFGLLHHIGDSRLNNLLPM